MVVMGYRIPKGTPLMMPTYAMHVNASNYLQPRKFWPERWLNNIETDDTFDSKSES